MDIQNLHNLYTQKRAILIPLYFKYTSIDVIIGDFLYNKFFEIVDKVEILIDGYIIVLINDRKKVKNYLLTTQFREKILSVLVIFLSVMTTLMLFIIVAIVYLLYLIIEELYYFFHKKFKKPLLRDTNSIVISQDEKDKLKKIDAQLLQFFKEVTSTEVCLFAQDFSKIISKLDNQLEFTKRFYTQSSQMHKLHKDICEYKLLLKGV